MGIAANPPYENVHTPQPTIEQQLKTAAQELPKLAMGIMPQDTLRPFVEVDKENLWKYQTSSGHPTLPPMGRTRIAPPDKSVTEEWKAIAAAIIETLPGPVQARLSELKSLPSELRNNASFDNYDAWAALDSLVNLAAQSIVQLSLAVRISQSESAKNEALLNSELPSIITRAMADQAQEMAQLIKEELKKRENDPAYDATNYLISQFEPLVNQLTKGIEPHE